MSAKTPESHPRQDQTGAGARAITSAGKELCATAGDSEAETAGGTLSCPDERRHAALQAIFRWLLEAGCCSASLLKFSELCSKHT
jgi:hypothetical protein